MKYRVLLKFLQVLVYIKRFFWQIGAGIYFVLKVPISLLMRLLLHLRLKLTFFFRRIGVIQSNEWVWKRDVLQIVVFIALFLLTLSQTKLVARTDLSYVGQKTLAYTLIGGDQETAPEEVLAPSRPTGDSNYSWKTGAISVTEGGGAPSDEDRDLSTIVAGGSALTKPVLMPGVILSSNRSEETDYTVEPGDSLSSIAYEFGVSVPTIMWENNLTLRSLLKPGDTLKIPPTTGIMHTVKKGDTLKKIAGLYGAEVSEIIKFNRLKEDGSDLKLGERITVPNGTKPQSAVAVTKPPVKVSSAVSRRAAPPNSLSLPSIAGYVWPTVSHLVTQYFGLTHHALDIAGPWQSPIYATKEGTVVVSQCGWNSGYGCYIIIDHGGGVRSLYGHNAQLLVSAGDHVDTGQTIALMGNTGHVRGVTGIHSHFEIQLNGARINPLKYVH